MGTKVQGKSYLPGHYSIRDLNGNAGTGSWSLFFEDKMLKNDQHANCFLPKARDGFFEYDKGAMKQIMLQHEAIFRMQVFELHRLYKIQRDLMNELQKKEPHEYSITMETSLFNPFLFHMPSEDIQKIRQLPTATSVNSSYSRPSFDVTEDRQCPLHFLKEGRVQSDLGLLRNGASGTDCDLFGSKVKNFQKRVFDLQLPADAYIDSEEGEGTEKGKFREVSLGSVYSQNRCHSIESEGDMNLNLGTGDKLIEEGHDKKMDSYLQSSRNTHCLADLNEPIQGICSEEVSALASVNRVDPRAFCEEIQGQELPMEHNLRILSLPKDVLQYNQKCRDEWNLSNLILSVNEEHNWKWPSHSLKTGLRVNPISPATAFCHEKYHMSSDQSQVDINKAHQLPQFLTSERGKREAWVGGKASCAEMTRKNSSHSVSNVIEQVASPISLHSAIFLGDDADAASPSISSWKKPADSISQVPSAMVQALTCADGSVLDRHNKSSKSSLQSPSINKDRWDLNVSFSSHPSSMTEVPHHGFLPQSNILIDKQNLNCSDCSFYGHNNVHGNGRVTKGMQCTVMNSAKDMNLILSLPNCIRDGISSEVDLVLTDGEGKHEDRLCGVSWLRSKQTSNKSDRVGEGFTQKDLVSVRCCSQVFSSGEAESQPFHIKIEKEKGPPGSMKDCAVTLHTKDAEGNKFEVADGASRKIVSFPALTSSPILEDPCRYSSLPFSFQYQSGNADTDNGVLAGLPCVDTSSKSSSFSLEKKLLVEVRISEKECNVSSSGFRGHINLNSVPVTSKEQPPESLEERILCENDRDVAKSSVPEASADIDLEATVTLSHVVKDVPTESEALGTNQLIKCVQPKHFETDSHDTLVRTAVEAILAMSTCDRSHLDDANCHPSSSALRDSLIWFSEVVSLKSDDLDGVVAASKVKGNVDNELSDDAIDFFEAMTLKLTEMKVECCWKAWEQENVNEEETCSSKLLTRPRRAQRRGRQGRDFQKDILPGLVTLSRHEVTEDLQTIGGLMRSCGCSWEAGTAKKNEARNGRHCRARERQKPRGLAAGGLGNWSCLQPRQSSNGETEHEVGISLQGWGKTTRRCRRPRSQVVIPPLH